MDADLSNVLAGARNCIGGYGGAQPGERILLWTDGSGEVDSEVVEGLRAAADELGAETAQLVSPAPVFRLGEKPSPSVEQALEAANLVVHILPHNNAASIDNVYMLRYMFEFPCRFIAVIATTVELMKSSWATYPMELYWELFRRSAEQVTGGPFHLSDAYGTDLRGWFKPWVPSGRGDHPAGVAASGSWTFFPSGNVPLHPESPLEGRMVFDSLEGFGMLDEPILLEVRDHRVTHMDGAGDAAEWLREMLNRYENADYVCELTWGIHPKASKSLGMASKSPDTVLYRHPGVWHAGLGMWPGVGVPARFHWDGGGTRSTLTIRNEVVIEQGRFRLLDEPELRSVAERFGDPDELLAVEA